MDNKMDNISKIIIDNQEIQIELPESITIKGFNTVEDIINGIIKIQEEDQNKTILSVSFVDGMLHGKTQTPDTTLEFENNKLMN